MAGVTPAERVSRIRTVVVFGKGDHGQPGSLAGVTRVERASRINTVMVFGEGGPRTVRPRLSA
jgi:hypothetical protein